MIQKNLKILKMKIKIRGIKLWFQNLLHSISSTTKRKTKKPTYYIVGAIKTVQ
jgi:hypothetical protein